jgi:ubiquitin carboxyl-terminal hydrolase 5/13
MVELKCGSCGNQGFSKQSLFKTFPTILAINARRFEIVNWLPTKQDVPVIVGDNIIDFERYRSRGKQSDEEELPDDDDVGAGAAVPAFVANETALEMLMSMGFPKVRCEKALYATGNADAEMAATWLFEHMEDPDIDAPLDLGGTSGGPVDHEKIENLENMGFSAPQARQALKETGGDIERAVDWLFSHPDATGDFGQDDAGTSAQDTSISTETKVQEDTRPAKFSLNSIVCHKGASIHAGHYVAFIKKQLSQSGGEGWVLFNDEKVALGGDVEEMKKFAYIYFFRREGA